MATFKSETIDLALVEKLDTALPQTQCTRCGYPSCRAYAEALAQARADIDQCPPGGDTTARRLARHLGRDPQPPNPAYGIDTPRTRAVVDEPRCIGCRKCIDVCPVDAILGSRKRMHTVLVDDCTGCGLCLPACPVECIALVDVTRQRRADDPWPDYGVSETSRWRVLAARRRARLARRDTVRPARRAERVAAFPDRDTIRSELQAALQRARARRRGSPT